MSFKVVSTCNIPFVVKNLGERFHALEEVEFANKPCLTENDIISNASDANAVVVGAEPYTRRVIDSLKSCRLIATPKMGYDNIDIAAATEAGICVSCVAAVSTEEVSDHTMALLLACARKVFKVDKAVRAGVWRSIHGPEMEEIWQGILPLRGQTLGLIGFGQIPRALVPKAKGFGLRVLVYDPYVPAEVTKDMGAETVGFDQLLQESDFVSVLCALTPENRHMLGAEQFKMMKPTAYLINTARGPLVDEKALYASLIAGEIAGAALDVIEVEPIVLDNPLLKLDNAIITGHSGHYSDRAIANIRHRPFEDVSRILSGEWPRGWVNPEVEAKYQAKWGNPFRKVM
ncbi:MAG: C-terminal binding protein [Chloroflexi bacterium]|nr:C-terminal binding protein [Chloroflexota bacterium]